MDLIMLNVKDRCNQEVFAARCVIKSILKCPLLGLENGANALGL